MNLAEQLNLSCTCRTLDATRLRESLPASMAQSHPHLFSETVVFIDTPTRNAIAQAVAALDRVTRLPGYQQAVEERAHGANARQTAENTYSMRALVTRYADVYDGLCKA